MQFGEQLWLKRDPRLWRAPSSPKVLAQYLLRGGAAEREAKRADENTERKTEILMRKHEVSCR